MGEPITSVEMRSVCSDCFEDPGLKALIEANAEVRCCDFCGGKKAEKRAAPLNVILEYIAECISSEYDLAANCLPWESAEGGWQYGAVWNVYELLSDELQLDLPNDTDGSLFDAICEFLGDEEWCQMHPFALTPSERLLSGWERFCQYVTYERRFFFREAWTPSNDIASQLEEMSPTEVLEAVTAHCGAERVRELKAGSRFFRARFQPLGERFEDPKTLGSPPAVQAVTDNRMNPPGIPMLYLSEDVDTAVQETQRGPGTYALAEFEVGRDALVLDLTKLPKRPSIFEATPDERHATIFLRGFVHSMMQPSARDDRIHLDYLPTQVVTEYFRTVFHLNGRRIDGILYPSVVHKGGTNLVLFATQADLVDGAPEPNLPPVDPPWIRLISHDARTIE